MPKYMLALSFLLMLETGMYSYYSSPVREGKLKHIKTKTIHPNTDTEKLNKSSEILTKAKGGKG